MLMWGSRASSQRGSRQVVVPSSSSTAGSSTQRTTSASSSTAAASPNPNSLMTRSFTEHERQEHAHHDRRGRADHASGERDAVGHRRGRVALAHPLLAHARDQEHLVVHRQPEHDGEHQHGNPWFDRSFLDPDHAPEPAPLEHGHRDPSAPPMLRRFISAAWIGITTERNITNSSSAERTTDDPDEQRQLAREHVREVDRTRR